MRVVHINPLCGIGCTGRIVCDLVSVLEQEGHESMVVYSRKSAPDTVNSYKMNNYFDTLLNALHTRITDRDGFGTKHFTKKMLKVIDEFCPDIIHLQLLHGYYINLDILFKYIRKKKIPVVWTFHDCWAFTGHCPHFVHYNCNGWLNGCHKCPQVHIHPKCWFFSRSKQNYKDKLRLYSDLKNFEIITPSKWLADLVGRSMLNKIPVNVIHNGIDLDKFSIVESDFREKNSIQDKFIILGVSSTWGKTKGIDDFCKLQEMLDDRFLLVMVGLTKEQIKRLPDGIIKIGRTNSVDELAEVYSAADVFFNPTYLDNFPTTNIEALACGTPVITYDTGGSPEAIDECCGYVIPQGDLEAAKQKFLELYNNSFDKMDCIRRSKLFDKKERYADYIRIYKKLIKDKEK